MTDRMRPHEQELVDPNVFPEAVLFQDTQNYDTRVLTRLAERIIAGDPLSESELETMAYGVMDFVAVHQKGHERTAAIEKIATTDKLTGLPNRYALRHLFASRGIEAVSTGRLFACFFVDLDSLDEVNNETPLKHKEGDQYLRTVVGALQINNGFDIIRFGGDEFLMLGTLDPGETDEENQRIFETKEAFIRRSTKHHIDQVFAPTVAEYVSPESLGISIGGLYAEPQFAEALGAGIIDGTLRLSQVMGVAEAVADQEMYFDKKQQTKPGGYSNNFEQHLEI